MAKPEWGLKRSCQSCGARFYDLRRTPIVCPVCSAVYDPERQPKTRRGGTAAAKDEPAVAPVPAVDAGATKEVADDVEANTDDAAVIDADADVDGVEEPAGDEGETEADADDLATENEDLIEDTSDLGEDDDDIGEVMEHLDDDNEDRS